MNDAEKEIEDKKFTKITKQVGFNYLTIIAQILLAPVLVALLTKTLTVSEYGVYSLLIVFVFFSMSALELGLSQFIITKISGMRDDERIKSFFSILKFEIIFISIALVIFLISPLGNYFLKINRLSSYKEELIICVFIVFIATVIRLCISFFKAEKRINIANFLDMLFNKGWALILLLFFLIAGKFTLKMAFQLWLLGAVITFVFAFYWLRKEIKSYIKLNAGFYSIRKSFYFSMPLILVIIANWALSMSNRYILNFYTTTAVVGVFALAFSLMGVITTFCTTISQVIQPYFTEAFMKKEKQDILINTSLKYALLLALPAMAVSIVWRKKIILLISTGQYLGAMPLFITLALYPLFAVIAFIFYQVLIAADRTKYVGLIHFISAIASILLNFVLIPVLGMQGAAIATILSYGFLATAMVIPGAKYIKIYFEFIKIPQIILAAAIIGVFCFVFDFVWSLLGEIILFVAAGVLYFMLVLVLKIIGAKEVAIIKRIIPGFLHSLLDYLAR